MCMDKVSRKALIDDMARYLISSREVIRTAKDRTKWQGSEEALTYLKSMIDSGEYDIPSTESEGEEIKLWECPDCAFSFGETHTDVDGGYSCPHCAEIMLTKENERLRAEIESLRAELLTTREQASRAKDQETYAKRDFIRRDKEASQLERERNEARQEARQFQIKHAEKIIKNTALKQANDTLLEGLRKVAERYAGECGGHISESEMREIARRLIAQYDTAKEAHHG